jgi:hypothetical protein
MFFSFGCKTYNIDTRENYHEGNTMRKIMGIKSQVSSAIIIHCPVQISWNDCWCFYNYRAETGTFSRNTWWSPGTLMGGLVCVDKKDLPGMPGANLFHSLWERFGDIWVFPCFSQWWFSHVNCEIQHKVFFCQYFCSSAASWRNQVVLACSLPHKALNYYATFRWVAGTSWTMKAPNENTRIWFT